MVEFQHANILQFGEENTEIKYVIKKSQALETKSDNSNTSLKLSNPSSPNSSNSFVNKNKV